MISRNVSIILTACLLALVLVGTGVLLAQDTPPEENPECSPQALANRQATFADILALDFENDPEGALANLYRLGTVYQDVALQCGYQPTQTELDALAAQVLSLMEVSDLLMVNAVGTDVDAIMADLETVTGDSFSGGLLYDGIEPALDGSILGCAGCHNGETGPLTEATWTRVDEIRLQDPALEGYTVRRYLVESIVAPNAYIVPEYDANLMPTYYGSRLDIQQIANIVAYLESQDQFLDE